MMTKLAHAQMENRGNRSLVIGLGSGRCGTTSLSRLLSDQPTARVLHEGRIDNERHVFNWGGDPRYVTGWLHELSCRIKTPYWGDIGFYFLPYVEQILTVWEDARFVVLKRDVTETVASFERKAEGRNFWMLHDGSRWDLDPRWDPKFPKYDSTSRREAITRYWREYYERVDELVERFPDNVAVFRTDDLNSLSGRRRILEFIGISDGRIEYNLPIRENKSIDPGEGHKGSVARRLVRRLGLFRG